MAIVYLARDARHDRPVALKLLRPELGSTIGPERFQREIRLVARLQHPHILPIFDSGETGGQLWYTMPFVEGESLRERLRRDVQLPWSEAVRLACEIAGALEYAHREGVVHRDIKPENVLLSDGQALVADFGVAKAVQDGWDEQLTETGLALGTPSYMSPEQAAGGRVDGRSDIYALGCVLYEMLAGEPPYTGPTAQVVIAKRFSDPVPSICRLRPEVPTFVDATILRALARSPADRFGSPAEFITALQATPRDRSRRRWLVIPGLIAAAVVGYAVVTSRAPAPGRTSNSTNTRLAVLPLDNIGDPADAFFAEGVSDEIRGRLSRTPDLTVLARATMQRIANDTRSPQEIAKVLGVGYLLAGTVRWARDSGSGRIQVRPELIRARDGATQWQETYDAPLGDLFRIQAEIADQVAREIVTVLGTPAQPQVSSGVGIRAIPNTDSYLRYLRGQAELDHYTDESNRQAERLFSQAIALDSTFGEAYAGLADALNFAQITSLRARSSVACERPRGARSSSHLNRRWPTPPSAAFSSGSTGTSRPRSAAFGELLSSTPTTPGPTTI